VLVFGQEFIHAHGAAAISIDGSKDSSCFHLTDAKNVRARNHFFQRQLSTPVQIKGLENDSVQKRNLHEVEQHTQDNLYLGI